MLAFLRLFLNYIWRIRHTDEMRSILEVGSEQIRNMKGRNYLQTHPLL